MVHGLDQHADDHGCEQTGQGTADQRTDAQAGKVAATGRRNGGDASDLDTDTGEIGKTTQDVRSDDDRALLCKLPGMDHLTHGYVGVEFIENGLLTEKLTNQCEVIAMNT